MVIFAAPSSPPVNVRVNSKTPHSLAFAWDPPPSEFQNGIIRKYLVNVTDVASEQLQMFEVVSTSLAVNDLHPYYQYQISVSAFTVAEGPSTGEIGFFTDEAGKQT